MINMLPFVKDNMMFQDEPIMNLQQFVNSYFNFRTVSNAVKSCSARTPGQENAMTQQHFLILKVYRIVVITTLETREKLYFVMYVHAP